MNQTSQRRNFEFQSLFFLNLNDVQIAILVSCFPLSHVGSNKITSWPYGSSLKFCVDCKTNNENIQENLHDFLFKNHKFD